jgi:predicted DNA-binding transcriptional regulator YafY
MKDFIRQVERVQMLNKLIASRRTGSPDELANRLGVSRSQLYLIIEYLKDMGLRISFSRKSNSFYYEKEARLSIEFSLKVMSSEEVRNIAGGKITSPNTAHPFFWTPLNYF